MTADLHEAIRKWGLETIPYDKNDPEVVAAMESKDARDILVTYHNWMSRHILAQPRRVHISKAYRANPLVAQNKADLDALLLKMGSGEELKPHLSKRVDIAVTKANATLSRRPELDLMLNEWKVHHLHISQAIESDGFVKRGDLLLFVRVRGEAIYVLDLMTHKDFNRDHTLKILVEEWPQAKLIHELQAGPGQRIIGLAQNYNEQERDRLRKAGVNTLVEIEGKVYKPAGGIMSSGVSIDSATAANEAMIGVAAFETEMRERSEGLQAFAKSYHKRWPENPKFEFGLLPGTGLGFKELSTRLGFQIA